LLLAACASAQQPDAEVLMKADRDFARDSAARGTAAWEAVMAPNATKPDAGGTWIVGPKAIREQMAAAFAKGLTLEWEPVRAEISRGGRLGFTWGRYKTARSTGTYMTVWEKQPDGSWKILFDTGDPD
jgi:ketosteroid isomerase-like protein